jgi:enoyl-CoA hydratase
MSSCACVDPEKRNCLPREFWSVFPKALERARLDPEIRCVLITAEGPLFSSGIDLSLLEFIGQNGESLDETRRRELLRRTVLSLQASLSALACSPLPVIVAIQGGCVGGAFDLALAADIRLCEGQAYFVTKEMDLGFIPDLGTVQRLSTAVPPAVANDWLLTARQIPADEALRAGLVSRVAGSIEDLQTMAHMTAARIAALSPMATLGAKEMLQFTRTHGVEASLSYTAAWQAAFLAGHDLDESFAALKTQRRPKYLPLPSNFPVPGVADIAT